MSPEEEMKWATLRSSCEAGEACTSVPGTMQMDRERASATYASRYVFQCVQALMKPGSDGTQDVRWYSGRTARCAPCEAASRMKVTAFLWLLSTARG